jgi:hypothetical protein
MSTENQFNVIFKHAVDAMSNNTWTWPEFWDINMKYAFINEALNYAVENEYWEQAVILRDVKGKIE